MLMSLTEFIILLQMTDLLFSSLPPPPPPPPHLLKTLHNSLKSSTRQSIRYMWNDEYIFWNHISDSCYEDLEFGMHLLPNINLEHINLTSYSKMNVILAAQVLSSTVSNVLRVCSQLHCRYLKIL